MNQTLPLGLDQSVLVHFGGIADGPCALGTEAGTDRDIARVNRQRLLERFNASAKLLITPTPTFNKDLRIIVRKPENDLHRPMAEALITKRDDIILGIWSSDCLPVMLVDVDTGVIGATHMSRDNLVGGYTETIIDTMAAMGAGRITAYLGPCLQTGSHSIANKMAERLSEQHPRIANFYSPCDDPLFQNLDYAAFGAHELERLGVHIAHVSTHDTFTSPDYYSYRRRRLDGNNAMNLSIIGLYHR